MTVTAQQGFDGSGQATVRLVSALGLGGSRAMVECFTRSAADPGRPGALGFAPRAGGYPADSGIWAALDDPDSAALRAWSDLFATVHTAEDAQRKVPFAEVQPLVAVVAEMRQRQAGLAAAELVLLMDGSDVRHRALAALIEQWVLRVIGAAAGTDQPIKVSVRGEDVGYRSGTGCISVLNEEQTTGRLFAGTLDEQVYAAAERVFFTAAVRALTPQTTDTVVFYNALAGGSVAKALLGQAADLAVSQLRRPRLPGTDGAADRPIARRAVAVIATPMSGGGAPRVYRTTSVPTSVSHAAIHHRFGRAVSITHSGLDDSALIEASIRQEGLDSFITGPIGHRRLSTLAWQFVDSADSYEGQPFSACADLLYRHGQVPLAARLSALVEHWHRNRLWSKNLAPEMVLHDESHSQSVDRHVASVAEYLLQTRRLEPIDVYHLALAAWLHDWGHASAGQLDDAPAHPRHVRDVHGLLTRRRLSDREDLASHHQLNDLERVWTGLLSAHHQGWTSCDHRVPVAAAAAARIGAEEFSLQQWAELGTDRPMLARTAKVPAGSFDADVAGALPVLEVTPWKAGEKTSEQVNSLARQLLILLRLCDGADIGKHRVPHRDSLAGNTLDCWRAASALGSTSFDMLGPPMSAEYGRIFDPEAVKQVLRGPAGDAQREFHGIVQQAMAAEPDLPEKAVRIVERDLSYLAHLVNQHRFFSDHDSVASVHLAVLSDRTGGPARVIPLVRVADEDPPQTKDAGQQPTLERQSPERRVQKDVFKELGRKTDGTEDDTTKAALRNALMTLGLQVGPAQVLVRPGSAPPVSS